MLVELAILKFFFNLNFIFEATCKYIFIFTILVIIIKKKTFYLFSLFLLMSLFLIKINKLNIKLILSQSKFQF